MAPEGTPERSVDARVADSAYAVFLVVLVLAALLLGYLIGAAA